MKRIKNLYKKIYNIENIKLAHVNARKGKRHYAAVRRIDADPEKYVNQIYHALIDRTYKTSSYDVVTRKIGKKTRVIYKLPYYPDRIVHHCIMNITEPIWFNVLIRDTYSAIKNRGVHDGVKRIKHFLKDKANTTYCLKLDIKQFYPTINHSILKQIIRKKIKCRNTLMLLDEIIDSAPGVPIGNYLSQYFGNLYLAYFDHYCKETLKIKYYARYCDDIVILGPDKNKLRHLLHHIIEYLSFHLMLEIKSNYQIFPSRVRGIDFLGYRFFGDYTLVRKSIANQFKRRMRKILTSNTPIKKNTISSVMSYKGWLSHADAYRLWGTYHQIIQSKINL